MDTPDELREYLRSTPEKFADGRTCALCGVMWDFRLLAYDAECCECYCPDCIKDGEMERYLLKNEYTKEMIDKVLQTIKVK